MLSNKAIQVWFCDGTELLFTNVEPICALYLDKG